MAGFGDWSGDLASSALLCTRDAEKAVGASLLVYYVRYALPYGSAVYIGRTGCCSRGCTCRSRSTVKSREVFLCSALISTTDTARLGSICGHTSLDSLITPALQRSNRLTVAYVLVGTALLIQFYFWGRISLVLEESARKHADFPGDMFLRSSFCVVVVTLAFGAFSPSILDTAFG